MTAPNQPQPPKPPAGLGPEGRALWAKLSAGLIFPPHELVILERVCRTAERIAQLESELEGRPALIPGSHKQMVVNPLVTELRLQEGLLATLLGRLSFPDEGAEDGANDWDGLTASQRARKAALARWR